MTTYYVRPGVGSDSNGGTSWASDSWATLAKATTTVTAGDHTIIVDTANANTITTSTVYTVAAGLKFVSSSDGTSYTAGAVVTGGTNFGVDITINGQCSFHGFTFTTGNSGTTDITFGSADSGLYFEDCTFNNAGGAGAYYIGGSIASINCELETRKCTFTAANSAHSLKIGTCRWRSYQDTFFATGTVPTYAISFGASDRGADLIFSGGDFGNVSTTLVQDATVTQDSIVTFSQCKLGSGTTLATPTLGGVQVYCYDCSYDNAGTLTGVLFYHENYLGSTSISTSIYANDGAQYDGTNRCSWVVDGKAAASFDEPYESPWITVWNDDVSTSITPYLECVRSGSATAYTNKEVWVEFLARDTANNARVSLTFDRAAPLATAADQTSSSKGASDWTGENATSWFGKLEAPAAFTPDEVGHICARICVTGDNTIYVDPTIRGLA